MFCCKAFYWISLIKVTEWSNKESLKIFKVHLEKLSFRFFLSIRFLLLSLCRDEGNEAVLSVFWALKCLVELGSLLWADRLEVWRFECFLIVTAGQQDVTWEHDELLQLVGVALTITPFTSWSLDISLTVWQCDSVTVWQSRLSLFCCGEQSESCKECTQSQNTKPFTSVPVDMYTHTLAQ